MSQRSSCSLVVFVDCTLVLGMWPMPGNDQKSTGFTLVELLVVIAIIGILIALLLPAVQAAREAARRMQCQNNLKQIGLAVLNYESQWGIFPPSSCWPSSGSPPLASPDSFDGAARRETWCMLVLPFLEQQALYDEFDRTKSPADPANIGPRSVSLPVMLCPTDSFNRQPFMGTQGSESASFGDNWARGNYAANGGLGLPRANPYGFWQVLGPTSPGWTNPNLRGVMGINCAISLAQVLDGVSNTILLAEIRAGVTAIDPRGVWALGIASIALWGHGGFSDPQYYWLDDPGPNWAGAAGDNVMNCTQLTSAFGSDALLREGMACYDEATNEQTARSMHLGGVNTCFADGSIHWISDYIQTTPSTAGNLSVWDRLNCSADGLPVNGSQY